MGFVVENQVDAALAVQLHVLGAVRGNMGEAHDLEDRLQGIGGGRGELDEFKAHQAHWVFEDISHFRLLIISRINGR
ncbi:hypothetical protein D9M71_141930 [compost metagenome]